MLRCYHYNTSRMVGLPDLDIDVDKRLQRRQHGCMRTVSTATEQHIIMHTMCKTRRVRQLLLALGVGPSQFARVAVALVLISEM